MREGVERRLTTILAADVVGYSRLMGENEARTVAALRTHRKELIEPKLRQYRGRIVKLMGDGALMEFGSVVDAVGYAVEVQCGMRKRNLDVPEDEQIIYRTGINIGDIIVEEDDIYGDGVNVAARLEGLCEPGGVCIARNVFNQVRGKLDLNFESLGEQEVKNIVEPVTVYRVVLDKKAEALVTPLIGTSKKLSSVRRWQIAVSAAIVLLIVGGLIAWQPWAPEFEPVAVNRMDFPLPEKPSIAVLPFDNMSRDPEQEYFADGLTEDLITDLSKISGIFVIARNSTFTYKNKPTKVQQVAEDLGVRYVLEGSVRRSGNEVRINAQLVDAIGGHHVWAERYDGMLSDVFTLQDQVIAKIVAGVAVNLTADESKQLATADTAVFEAYDAVLVGWNKLRQGTEEETLKSISLFERAIELDPDYGRAYAALAVAYWRLANLTWFSASAAATGFQNAMERMNDNLSKAMARSVPIAFATWAEVLARQGRYEEAFSKINRAIALAPNDPDNYISNAKILNATGRAPDAEEMTRRAMRLNPQYPPDYLRVLAISLFHQERYAEALVSIKRALSRHPDATDDYILLTSALGYLGREEEYEAAIENYNQRAIPAGFSPLNVQEAYWWFYGDAFNYDASYIDRLAKGLRRAGVREGAGVDLPFPEYRQLLSKKEGEYDVAGAKKIDFKQAKALHERGVAFVDVRAATDFDRGHIPRSVNLDLTIALSEDTLSRVVGKDEEVVFGCHGKYCPYSAYASAKAVKWGFKYVYYFAGGFPAWKDAGYPVAKSPDT